MPKAKSIMMLSGPRFSPDANAEFLMPKELFNQDNPVSVGKYVSKFIQRHYDEQVPRLTTLERYYQGYNDILYWNSKKAVNRADNKIPSGYPKSITNIRVGYAVGNPIQYKFNNRDGQNNTDGEKILQLINDFNNDNDIEYHDKMMKKHLSVTGRAYEMLYSPSDETKLKVKNIDPTQAFVVYEADIEKKPLFAVYYYPINFDDDTNWQVTVYTIDNIYTYPLVNSPLQDYSTLVPEKETSVFIGVPILESKNNAERMGDWETKLNEIDAVDKSLSEMANSQEDFNNAILCISGKLDLSANHEPILDENGDPIRDSDGNILYKVRPGEEIDPKARIMFLKASVTDSGTGTPVVTQTTAEYLTKELNADGWKTYMDKLNADIHKDTNTPDVADENFASNASGVAMSYKLWGQDQERSIQESLYKRMLMNRYRLLAASWYMLGKDGGSPVQDLVNQIEPVFSPNLPKNDSEKMAVAKTLSETGAFSDQTIQEYAASVTGIQPSEEERRVDDETEKEPTFTLGTLAQNSIQAMQGKVDKPDKNTDVGADM
ncbi:phage portal protein [Pediococcus stilesii]|uniref:Phage portal protein n=1 Tax=Pediococcus stilesii TaxID=331679 RepID=A0A5R9BZD8_9LACO|nr:phage portal protein [Pediococcus stilesii]TLQ05471.1 phage portal protein [Pediococcus stilesii]